MAHKDPGLINAALGYDVLVQLIAGGRERRLRERLAALAKLAPGERVLDAGCGTGSLAIVAKRIVGPSGEVSGCDASEHMIARARRKARHAGVGVDFRVARAESLPYGDASFDAVLGTMMLHHLRRDARAQFAAEARRVLKPGGRLVVADIGPPKRVGLVEWLHRKHHMTLEKLTDVVTSAGLEVRETGDVGAMSLIYVTANRGHEGRT